MPPYRITHPNNPRVIFTDKQLVATHFERCGWYVEPVRESDLPPEPESQTIELPPVEIGEKPLQFRVIVGKIRKLPKRLFQRQGAEPLAFGPVTLSDRRRRALTGEGGLS
jgi:hypothetical protein